ncbi:periplasmic heavy metal sensor [Phaeobacter sp. NW0010-22]|uniref:periplasmic heavy metal sensor n=1 Tax=Phaeobacter sp. NW0010-22 TaxID=3135907 RepID=UPI0013E07422
MSEPKQKSRLWLRILLGVSLSLNLLVVGLAVGAVMRLGGPDGMRPPPSSLGSALFRAMPREHRSEMHQKFRDRRSDKGKAKIKDAQAVAALLRAVPFDAAALTEALKKQKQDRDAFFETLQVSWLERINLMSDAERSEYADRLENMAKHKRKWSDRKREGN